MKKAALIGPLVLLLSCTTYGQSVTMYGIVDTGIEFLDHVGLGSRPLMRMPANTGLMPSRWGLRGVEPLEGGLQVIFTLENGFNMRGGDISQGGRLFGRQAWIGLSNSWGTLSVGRQYTMTNSALLDNEISGPSVFGLVSFDNYLPNARADNGVAYKAHIGPFTIGAMYSFGRDSAGTGNAPGQGTCAGEITGNFQQCRNISALMRYDTVHFGTAASYEEQRGGTNAAFGFFDGLPSVPLGRGGKDIRTEINAYVKFVAMKFDAGWLGRRVDPGISTVKIVRSDLFFAGASYQLTPSFNVASEGFRMLNNEHDTRGTMAMLRGTYSLSKRTLMYLQGAYLFNSRNAAYSVSAGGPGSTPGMGMDQAGVMVGMQHTF